MGSYPADVPAVTMKRQRIPHQTLPTSADDFGAMSDTPRRPHHRHTDTDDDADDEIPLRAIGGRSATAHRPRNVLEAQVQDGDTLQAIAIRYSCSVADIKRLNKIERDFEIHAHKTLQVPLTADNILADHLTTPATGIDHRNATDQLLLAALDAQTATTASFNQHIAGQATSPIPGEPTINDIILNTKIERHPQYTDCNAVGGGGGDDGGDNDKDSAEQQQLLIGSDDDDDVPQPRTIAAGGRLVHDFSCSGSDCDMSLMCLLVVILALCVTIPLIYIVYIAEHHVDSEEVAAAAARVHHHIETAAAQRT